MNNGYVQMQDRPTELPIVSQAVSVESPCSGGRPKVLGKCSLIALGCPKNLVDGERILGLLRDGGWELTPDPEQADIVVINTCGFLRSAREESFAVIEEMLKAKRKGRIRGIIVAGCLVERDREAILDRFPEVDQLVNIFARDEITEAAIRIHTGFVEQHTVFRPASVIPLDDRRRLRVTPRHLAYLKISEGCNRLCTFCTIPHIRGRYVSKPIDAVIEEAHELVADGVRELVIVAQDTTYYGLDLAGRPLLAELLRRLRELSDLRWIRLMYLYPMYITDELIEVIREGEPIVPYLDLPLQHISDRILKRMKRRVSAEETKALLAKLREAIPNLVLRTTMIVGFPGETEAEFQELVSFVRGQRFERLGVFEYSREPGTPAARLRDHLPRRIIRARREQLMAVQQEIAFAWAQAQVRKRVTVLVDQPYPERKDVFIGRTYADAPEIDGVVYITGKNLQPGQFVNCEVVAAEGYDLVAAPLED
ncbi:MAG: 30S ribosomal protein S12 methylthiotransferase RimO [Thermogutta sp.]